MNPQIAQRVRDAIEHIVHGVGQLNVIYQLDSHSREKKKGGDKLRNIEMVSELRDSYTSQRVFEGRCHIATIISNSIVGQDSSPPSLLDIAQWAIKGIRLEKREKEEIVSGYWGECLVLKIQKNKFSFRSELPNGIWLTFGREGKAEGLARAIGYLSEYYTQLSSPIIREVLKEFKAEKLVERSIELSLNSLIGGKGLKFILERDAEIRVNQIVVRLRRNRLLAMRFDDVDFPEVLEAIEECVSTLDRLCREVPFIFWIARLGGEVLP